MKELDNRLHYAQKAFAEKTNLPKTQFADPLWTYFPPNPISGNPQDNRKKYLRLLYPAAFAFILWVALTLGRSDFSTVFMIILFMSIVFLPFIAFFIYFINNILGALLDIRANEKNKKIFAQNNKGYILNANYLCAFLPNIFDAELELEYAIPIPDIVALNVLPDALAIYIDQAKPFKIILPQQEIVTLKSNILALSNDILDADK